MIKKLLCGVLTHVIHYTIQQLGLYERNREKVWVSIKIITIRVNGVKN